MSRYGPYLQKRMRCCTTFQVRRLTHKVETAFLLKARTEKYLGKKVNNETVDKSTKHEFPDNSMGLVHLEK